jgi:hypothetical protein
MDGVGEKIDESMGVCPQGGDPYPESDELWDGRVNAGLP